jgi:FkbM family methyltransferase
MPAIKKAVLEVSCFHKLFLFSTFCSFMKKLIQKTKSLIQKWLTDLLFNRYLSDLKPGGTAIDCGANVGDISLKLAKTGVEVYAFEPNPYAFEKLQNRLKGYSNVTCLQKGVWDKNTVSSLFFHKESTGDEAFWSFGSSLLRDKNNVDKGRSVEVEIIDLTEFIENLGREIDLLKIDIEGAECELLEKFIEKKLYKKVRMTLVETHDSKIAGQKEKTDRIRKQIKENKIKNINLTWL